MRPDGIGLTLISSSSRSGIANLRHKISQSWRHWQSPIVTVGCCCWNGRNDKNNQRCRCANYQHIYSILPGAQPRIQSWESSSFSLLQIKIRQVYPVWCSWLHNQTLFIKKLRKNLGGSSKFLGGSDRPTRPPSGCIHDTIYKLSHFYGRSC